MQIDYQTFQLIQRRASYGVWLRFGINKAELQFLCMLSALLRAEGRRIMNKQDIFHTITGNSREMRKLEGYLRGYMDKKFLGCFEYVSRPGSLCLGISDLGLSVIRSYEGDLEKLATKYETSKAIPLQLSQGTHRYIAKVAA